MADVTVKRTEDFEAIFGGGFRRVRAGLGVSSFGLAVMDLPPNFKNFPTHDQSHDGQEEVYTALSGSATLEVGGEQHTLEPGVWARVGPDEKRKIVTGDEPVRILAIGGMPGEVYTPPAFSVEGASASHIKAKMIDEDPEAAAAKASEMGKSLPPREPSESPVSS